MSDAPAPSAPVTAAPSPAPAPAPAPASPPPASPPPATPNPAPAPATALDAPEQPGQQPAPASWPENWRDLIASGDEGARKQLERMNSPADVMKSYRELIKKQSSGQLKAALPEGATPEQVTAWRKENGIPETHDAYDLTLDDGLVIGEHDKPMIDGFLKDMHAANAPPALVKQALGFYYKEQQRQVAEIATRDAESRQQAVQSLQSEWGGEFKGNVDGVKNLLVGNFGEEVASALYFSRLPDGSLFGNNPAVIKGLAKLAREVNPAGTLVPAGGNQAMAIGDEIQKYEKMLREDRAGYDRDPKNAERFAQLLDAQKKLGAR